MIASAALFTNHGFIQLQGKLSSMFCQLSLHERFSLQTHFTATLSSAAIHMVYCLASNLVIAKMKTAAVAS